MDNSNVVTNINLPTDKNNKWYVVGLGELLIDCFPNGKHKLGGAPAIFAYHAKESSDGAFNSLIVSAIGKDGKIIADKNEVIVNIDKDENGNNIERKKLNYFLYKNDRKTGEVNVDATNPNDPKYTINTDVAWTEIPYSVELEKIAQHTLAVYFGSLASYCGKISEKTIDCFLSNTPSNCLKIFDVNLRNNPNEPLYSESLLIKLINSCNVLKVNLEELGEILPIVLKQKGYDAERAIASMGDIKKCKVLMHNLNNIRLLIVTMGEDGSSIFWREKTNDEKSTTKNTTDDEEYEIAFSSLGMPAKVKNTVGAGDALAGAFIGEILRKGQPYTNQSSLLDWLLHNNKEEQNSIYFRKVIFAAHHFAVNRATLVCEEDDSMPKKILQKELFVCYAHQDKDIVNLFGKKFKENNISFWLDSQDLDTGSIFQAEIERAIRNCNAFIYFSSKYSNESDYIKNNEIPWAIKYDKNILPIKLDKADLHEDLMKTHHFFDCDFDFTFSKLMDDIKQKITE